MMPDQKDSISVSLLQQQLLPEEQQGGGWGSSWRPKQTNLPLHSHRGPAWTASLDPLSLTEKEWKGGKKLLTKMIK